MEGHKFPHRKEVRNGNGMRKQRQTPFQFDKDDDKTKTHLRTRYAHSHTDIQINTPADKKVNTLKCVSKICREKMAVIVLSCF